MRIFDCFIMRDETDLLEIRIAELKDYVDFFVIVEANKTFSGENKPLFIESYFNCKRLEFLIPQVRYVPVTDMPEVINGDRWPLEFHQRDAIMRGLYDLQDNDIVMISDLDEIWDPRIYTADNRSIHLPFVFSQMPIVGYLNILQLDSLWYGTAVVPGSQLKNETPQQIRNIKNGLPQIKGGWHFSWVGGEEMMARKQNTFCHTVKDCLDKGYPGQIMRRIESMDGVATVDISLLPKYVQDNLDYFKKKGMIYV